MHIYVVHVVNILTIQAMQVTYAVDVLFVLDIVTYVPTKHYTIT